MYTFHSNRSSFFLMLALAYAIASGHQEASCVQPDVITTITFDDPAIPFQSIDDFSLSGVTFDFKLDGVDSTEAYYKSGGPGSLTYVDDPSLTGNSAGILTLSFDHPTHTLQFGVALNTGSSLSPGFLVELFNAKQESLGVTPVNVVSASVLGFTEGFFNYQGLPLTRAVIDFQHQPGSFALDNLTFVGIPEPGTMLLGVIAVITGILQNGVSRSVVFYHQRARARGYVVITAWVPFFMWLSSNRSRHKTVHSHS